MIAINNQNFESAASRCTSPLQFNNYIKELVEIYISEKKLNASLPAQIFNAENQRQANALTRHLKFTQEHIRRLETLFESINQPLPQ